MKLITFKVQVDGTGRRILVYSEDMSYRYEGPKPKGLNLGPMSKRYALGFINEKQEIAIEQFLPASHEEDW